MIKQIKNAIYGQDGRMEMKELVSVNLLIMTWVMLLTAAFKQVEWSDAWIYAIPLALVGSTFGVIWLNQNKK